MSREFEIKKHAYLIMAHKNIEQINILLGMLDDSRNDIFLHVDRRYRGFCEFREIKKAGFSVLPSRIVLWGHSSQIDVELDLISAAVEAGNYSYLHLLIGQCLPIKSQDAIHSFLEKHEGMEFISFAPDSEKCSERVKLFHLPSVKPDSSPSISNYIRRACSRVSLEAQRLLGVDRFQGVEIKKGSAYFSITNELARALASDCNEIRRRYKHTKCADEIFLQTYVWNSSWRDRLYHRNIADKDTGGEEPVENSLRLIDWGRGNPYIWHDSDWLQIKEASPDIMFARKFDIERDRNIVNKIVAFISNTAT